MLNFKKLIDYDKDDLDRYFNSLSKFVPMSKKEEQELSKRFKKNNDIGARDKLLKSATRYVVKLAYKYKGYVNNTSISFLDLVQEGNLGLIRAAEKFNPKFKIKFATYAACWIESRIRKYIIEKTYPIKINTSPANRVLFFKKNELEDYKKRNAGNLIKDANAIFTRGGKGFSNKQVDDYIERLEKVKNMWCLDGHLDSDGHYTTFHDIHTNRANDDKNNSLDFCENKEIVDKMKEIIFGSFKVLNKREQIVISKRFFKTDNNANQITLTSIAKDFGLSRERVRQLEKKALVKLKQEIELKHCDIVKSYYE